MATGLKLFERPVPGQCQCVSFTPHGNTVAAGDIAGHIWLFSNTGDPYLMLTCDNGCPVESLCFAPDGRTLASCGLHGRVRVWDLRMNSLRRSLDCEDTRIWRVAFSPDGKSLVCGAQDGLIRTWKASSTYAARFVPSPAGKGGVSLAFSPDGKTLAIAGPDGSLSFLDRSSLQPKSGTSTLQVPGKGRHLVRFEASGNVLCVCGPDGSLERWDVKASLMLDRMTGPGKPPRTLCNRPETDEWLACLEDSPPFRWNAATGRCIAAALEEKVWTAAAWSADGSLLVASSPKHVHLFGTNTGAVTNLALSGRSEGSPAVSFSPDSKTAGGRGFWRRRALWDTATGHAGPMLEGRQLGVDSVAFSPDGTVLAVGGQDGFTVKMLVRPHRPGTFRADCPAGQQGLRNRLRSRRQHAGGGE